MTHDLLRAADELSRIRSIFHTVTMMADALDDADNRNAFHFIASDGLHSMESVITTIDEHRATVGTPCGTVAYSSADRNAAAEVANAYHNGEVTLVEMIRSIADIHANRSREQGASK
ncbi:hypothetical protein [Sphingosinicella sp.]|uniref:hypothetical protein n=1 Tax=Sphingosinicella sp. TaxID=1917971 RepID=UPI0026208691|nr:hypothetical protein [Sphingosinicella sp.]